MGLSFSLKRDDVSPALTRMALAARNPQAVMRSMGTTFKSITEGNFSSLGMEYRPAPWPAKRDGAPSILQKSTTMVKAFQLEVGDKSATVSNPMIYASIHQFGGVIHAKDGGYLRFKWGPGAGDWATVVSVTIPARPFFPVDTSGKLTLKAEEKIRRAGERALARQAGVEGEAH
jgi:phage gpG-like protein